MPRKHTAKLPHTCARANATGESAAEHRFVASRGRMVGVNGPSTGIVEGKYNGSRLV
jgi:hypothetical protein